MCLPLLRATHIATLAAYATIALIIDAAADDAAFALRRHFRFAAAAACHFHSFAAYIMRIQRLAFFASAFDMLFSPATYTYTIFQRYAITLLLLLRIITIHTAIISFAAISPLDIAADADALCHAITPFSCR